MTVGEILVIAGSVLMGVCVLGGIAVAIAFCVSGRRLKRRLVSEFGEKHH